MTSRVCWAYSGVFALLAVGVEARLLPSQQTEWTMLALLGISCGWAIAAGVWRIAEKQESQPHQR